MPLPGVDSLREHPQLSADFENTTRRAWQGRRLAPTALIDRWKEAIEERWPLQRCRIHALYKTRVSCSQAPLTVSAGVVTTSTCGLINTPFPALAKDCRSAHLSQDRQQLGASGGVDHGAGDGANGARHPNAKSELHTRGSQ